MTNSKAKIIGIIPARYGSTRFPGKPLAMVLGKSMIQRTYENALQSKSFDALVVATDDQRIFDHVQGFGGEALMTSPDCRTGTDRIAEVMNPVFRYVEAKIIVNIQGDEPCVNPHIFSLLIHALHQDPKAMVATPITPIRSLEEAMNPSLSKCVVDLQGNALYFSRALIPAGHSQSYRPQITYYGHIGIYAYRLDFLKKYAKLPISPLQEAEDLEMLKVLENGYRIKTVVVDEIPLGIDRPEDIKKVESYLCKQNSSS